MSEKVLFARLLQEMATACTLYSASIDMLADNPDNDEYLYYRYQADGIVFCVTSIVQRYAQFIRKDDESND